MALRTYEMINAMKEDINMLRKEAREKMENEKSNGNINYYVGKVAAYRECLNIINSVAIQFETTEAKERRK